MKGLDKLIRLHRLRVDEERRKLADIEALGDDIRRRIDNIDMEVTAERDVMRDQVVVGIDHSAYVAEAERRRETLCQSLLGIEAEIDEAREVVAERYRELKKLEHARDNRLQRQRYEEARREQGTLDEVSLNMFSRKEAS